MSDGSFDLELEIHDVWYMMIMMIIEGDQLQ